MEKFSFLGLYCWGVHRVRFVRDPIRTQPDTAGFRKLEKLLEHKQADFDCLKNPPEPYSIIQTQPEPVLN